MKRIGLLFLVVAMTLAAAACSTDKDVDPVGTWRVTFDWNCNGIDGFEVFHIVADGTYFVVDEDARTTGTWLLAEESITLKADDRFLVFTGTIDGDSMEGTYTARSGPLTGGCWTATRTSATP
jgi:hypothetical protein